MSGGHCRPAGPRRQQRQACVRVRIYLCLRRFLDGRTGRADSCIGLLTGCWAPRGTVGASGLPTLHVSYVNYAGDCKYTFLVEGAAMACRRLGFAAALGASASCLTSESADANMKPCRGNMCITSSEDGRLGEGWINLGAVGGDPWRDSECTGSGTGGSGSCTGRTGSET